jgi:hypothetical protein
MRLLTHKLPTLFTVVACTSAVKAVQLYRSQPFYMIWGLCILHLRWPQYSKELLGNKRDIYTHTHIYIYIYIYVYISIIMTLGSSRSRTVHGPSFGSSYYNAASQLQVVERSMKKKQVAFSAIAITNNGTRVKELRRPLLTLTKVS